MYYVQAINFKIPTIVGILEFITWTNDSVYWSMQENDVFFLIFIWANMQNFEKMKAYHKKFMQKIAKYDHWE